MCIFVGLPLTDVEKGNPEATCMLLITVSVLCTQNDVTFSVGHIYTRDFRRHVDGK